MFRIPSQSGCGKKTFRNNSKSDCYTLFIYWLTQLPNSISATPLDKKNRDYYLACFCPISRVKTSFGMTKTWQDSLYSVAWPWAMGFFQKDSAKSLSKNNKTLKGYYLRHLAAWMLQKLSNLHQIKEKHPKNPLYGLTLLSAFASRGSDIFFCFLFFFFYLCKNWFSWPYKRIDLGLS